MFLLASGDEINPLGHVLDQNLIGGDHALWAESAEWTVLGSPLLTIHMVTLVIAAILTFFVMRIAARGIATGSESEGNRRYLARGRTAQLLEVITVTLRDRMLKPLLGESTDKYLPYLMSLFFFILINNLIGLVPLLDFQGIIGHFSGLERGTHWAVAGGTATGNLYINAGLALIAFVVIQAHGIKELGILGWLHHLLGGAPAYLAPIMVPVEILGTIIKPCALSIRLFANMLAGHTLMATLMLFGYMAYNGLHSYLALGGVTLISGLFALAIYFLELFVAFLQAFVFMFLTAVFISQLSHHGDHEEGHEARTEPAAA